MKPPHQNHPDVERMLRFQSGDESAFEELVEAHHRRLINLGYRFLGNKQEAEDLAQEVFVRVYKSKASYRPTAAFTTWLTKIAVNLALNWKAKRKNALLVSLEEPLDATGETTRGSVLKDPSQKTPEEISFLQETRATVQKAVLGLPENQRIAVLLAHTEGLSLEEIAEALSVSTGAVKQLLFRAKTSLKKTLPVQFSQP